MSEDQRQQIVDLLQEAMELALRKRDVDGAMEKLNQVLEIDPDNDDALLNLGNCEMMRGNLADALAYFDRAAAADTENYGVDWNRAIVLLRLNRVEESLSAIHHFLERAGGGLDQQADQIVPNARAFKQSLEVLKARSDTESAYHSGEIVQTDSAEAELQFMKAAESSDAATAVSHLDRALTVDPAHPQARNMRGGLHMIQGHLSEAVRDFTVSLLVQPENPAPFVNRANCLLMASPRIDGVTTYYALALEDLNSAIALAPENVEVRVNRAKVLRLFKDYETAMADVAAALEINPRHVEGLYTRGLLRNATGDFEGAVADYDAALAIHPDRDDILPGLALARMAINDRAGAAQAMERYVERGCKGEMSQMQAHSFLRAMQAGLNRS
jgi:tetratricopeptide (TPR) repeat protein